MRKLYVLVESFSNEKKECFFEKELPYLCEKFEKIYVVPLFPDGTELSYKSDKIEIVDFNYFQPCNRVKIFLGNLKSIIQIIFFEISRTHHKAFYIKNFIANLNRLLYTFSAAKNLEKLIEKDIHSNTIFYCYWFKQWVSALSVIKIKYPELKLASRVHGGDYDEGQIKTTLQFRYFQLSKVDRIFPVSDFAKNYLTKTFKVEDKKLVTARLGLSLVPQIAAINEQQLHIVSCSYVIDLKRVHLIIDILNHINIPCKWTHFGDGPLLEEIRQKAKAAKWPAELKGYVSNVEFINYLRANPISFFINVSESEGIPVTMMEAIANGIPLIGTAVCGVPEIVTEETGFIFPINFDPKNVALQIEKSHLDKSINKYEKRQEIVNFYYRNYAAINNYEYLANKLQELHTIEK